MKFPGSILNYGLLLMTLLVSGLTPSLGQEPSIPLDTLKEGGAFLNVEQTEADSSEGTISVSSHQEGADSIEGTKLREWMFWDRDLSLDRFPDSLPPGKKVQLPMDQGVWEGDAPNGIGCLATRIFVPDSSVGRRFEIHVKQFGACEIYLDRERIGRIGKVGGKGEEERRYTRLLDSYQHVFRDSGSHTIVIRFSDQRYFEEKGQYEERSYGIQSFLLKRMEEGGSSTVILSILKWLGSLFGFLFALGVLHLLIFLFYPKKRSNLYYVLFIWALSFLVLYSARGVSEDPVVILRQNRIWIYALQIFSLSLLTMLYAFLRQKGFGWVYGGVVGGGVLFILLCDLGWIGDGVVHSLFWLPLVYIESFRVILTSMRRRDPGSWILGIGAGFFIVFPFILFLLAALLQDVGFSLSGYTAALVLGTWFMAIPFSMSVYLARDFAMTSKGLERKLQEVEELSEKNLQQEKEKQRILEEKKEELEEKVEERTQELRQEKERVEVAHQEIRDSIDYAQGIQEAVLPEEERYDELGEHFILFRPRDPVSGDFHWGRKEGEHFYIAAVDCTGHGVPGAFMSMLGVSYLNEIMANEPDASAGNLLTYLKQRVVKELSGRKGTAKDGMDAAILKVKAPSSRKEGVEVEFAGANNPLYWIRTSGEEGGAEDIPEQRVKPFKDHPYALEIKGDKGAVGYEEKGVEAFRTIHFRAFPGDALYIFSDGYADQFGGPKGKKFRYGAFKRLLVDIADKPMAEQKPELERQFDEWKGEREQVDDVIVVGVRV